MEKEEWARFSAIQRLPSNSENLMRARHVSGGRKAKDQACQSNQAIRPDTQIKDVKSPHVAAAQEATSHRIELLPDHPLHFMLPQNSLFHLQAPPCPPSSPLSSAQLQGLPHEEDGEALRWITQH